MSEDFDEFVGRELPGLLRYGLMLTGDPELTRDLVQDVLLKTHVRWPQVLQADRPRLYLRRMVTNEFFSWRRRWSVRNLVVASHHPQFADTTTDDPSIAVDERDAMWARLAELPRQQRAVLVLRFYEGLPDEQIADVLHCTTGTVRSHASRALATLRSRMSDPIEHRQERR